MISELASRTLAAANIAHREHWKTDSYAAHVALGSFYSGATDAIDNIIESYQGLYGKIEDFEVKTEQVDDIVEFLSDEADWIDVNRDEITQGSANLGNLIDTLSCVYTKTIFLLGLK
jgi:ERCC4-related helicase